MDRLTYMSERGFICIIGCTAKYSPKERKGANLNNAIVRLFAYENTGFSPSALEEMLDDAYDLGYQACLTHKGLNWSEAEELQHYRDAKAKGRHHQPPPQDEQTNADRIRAMSNKEMARIFVNASADGCPPEMDWDCSKDEDGWDGCEGCWKKWLGQPAKGGDQDGAD